MIPEAITILVPPNWSMKSRKGIPIALSSRGLKLRADGTPRKIIREPTAKTERRSPIRNSSEKDAVMTFSPARSRLRLR